MNAGNFIFDVQVSRFSGATDFLMQYAAETFVYSM